jgi:hypothetical protein
MWIHLDICRIGISHLRISIVSGISYLSYYTLPRGTMHRTGEGPGISLSFHLRYHQIERRRWTAQLIPRGDHARVEVDDDDEKVNTDEGSYWIDTGIYRTSCGMSEE